MLSPRALNYRLEDPSNRPIGHLPAARTSQGPIVDMCDSMTYSDDLL
jgi:hypothetical protein